MPLVLGLPLIDFDVLDPASALDFAGSLSVGVIVMAVPEYHGVGGAAAWLHSNEGHVRAGVSGVRNAAHRTTR